MGAKALHSAPCWSVSSSHHVDCVMPWRREGVVPHTSTKLFVPQRRGEEKAQTKRTKPFAMPSLSPHTTTAHELDNGGLHDHRMSSTTVAAGSSSTRFAPLTSISAPAASSQATVASHSTLPPRSSPTQFTPPRSTSAHVAQHHTRSGDTVKLRIRPL
ncbi:Os12g0173650 [Oryza sativa Japonica Group]|uniref:Os12g0173650 protein n=1 Tax=Oryza sativa subsp. japonica TaxID=39947 RepID=A0A0P0Y7L4_ORYSJ|nr:Os12g0173650 [Oryza sativa Japonica Group]